MKINLELLVHVVTWVVVIWLPWYPWIIGLMIVVPAGFLFVCALALKIRLRYGVRDKRAGLLRDKPVPWVPYAVARYKCKRQA